MGARRLRFRTDPEVRYENGGVGDVRDVNRTYGWVYRGFDSQDFVKTPLSWASWPHQRLPKSLEVTYHALLNAVVSKNDRRSAWRMVTEMKGSLDNTSEESSLLM